MTTLLIPPEAEPEAQAETTRAQRAVAAIKTIKVHTAEQIAIVSPLLQQIKSDQKRLKERKELITRPLNEALRGARDLFRPAEQALEECELYLKQEIGRAQQLLREANLRAMEATQLALAQNDVRAAAQASGAIQSTEAPQGLSFRERFTFRIVNAAILPREFLMPDEKRIREHVSKHGLASNIPGVVVEKDVQVIARSTPGG